MFEYEELTEHRTQNTGEWWNENRMVNMEFQLNGLHYITLSNELPEWL